eukprot:7073533-Pyramimonas_sp.AAC.1
MHVDTVAWAFGGAPCHGTREGCCRESMWTPPLVPSAGPPQGHETCEGRAEIWVPLTHVDTFGGTPSGPRNARWVC